jgi:hypothetical protein
MDEQVRKGLQTNLNKPAVALGDQAARLPDESEAADPGDLRKDLAELAAWAREMRDKIPVAVPGPAAVQGEGPGGCT